VDNVFIAIKLPEVSGRAVLRCGKCSLVQFRSQNSHCLKCHEFLFTDEHSDLNLHASVKPADPGVAQSPTPVTFKDMICANTKRIREEKDLSQRDLATRLGVPHTWISKIENGKVEIMPSSLVNLAKGLEVSIVDLITSVKSVRQSAIEREILSDPFLAEIAPLVCNLSKRNRVIFLAKVEFLATRKESAAA
jgi:transcriptional regulator with XRE-family HTH domain/uncharacterized C2H2 Zn-finger protein